MTQHPIAIAIVLAFTTSAPLSGCDRISNLTEQEHIQRAKDFEDKGNLKGSIVELKNAIQKNPDSPQARLLLGQVYLKRGMGAEAEKELTQAKKLGVNEEIINPPLGEALLLTGEYKRVLDEIQPMGQSSKANLARILQLRAEALLKLGQLQDACNLFQQSLDTDSKNPPTYWGLAQCAVAERDLNKAREWLDVALKIKDRQARTWVLIGELEQLNRNMDAALAAYSSALRIESDNLEALQRRAAVNISHGHMDAARIDIEKIRSLYPKSFAASYLYALLKFREEKYPEARDALQPALKISPNHLPALVLASSIEFALGNLETAELNLKKVVRTAPHSGFARRMLAATQLRLGRLEDATKILADIDLEKTKDAGLHTIAGEVALAKKEFSKAASHFEKATELSPNSAAMRTELGVARLALGDDDRAMADLQAAVDMEGSNIRADNILILNQLKQRQFDAALDSIAALERKHPQSPLPWNYRGAAYLGKKDTVKARDSFSQALRLDPKFFPAAANLAQLDLMDGQTANARKRFQSILKADPTHLQSMLALAETSLRNKDEKAYLNWLEKAAKAHPRSLPPREGLTRYLLSRGDKTKALATAQEAVNANPDNPAAFNLLGRTQLAVGDSANATITFTKLAKMASQSPDTYLNLALAQIAAKNLTDARTTLQTALKLKPNHLRSLDVLLRMELKEGKPEAALRIARKIQTDHPQSPLGFDREGDIQIGQKRAPLAIKAYEKALEKGGGSAGLNKLARANMMSGEDKKAEKLINDWLKQHPTDTVVRAHAADFFMANGRNKEAIAQYLEIYRQLPGNVIVINNLASLFQREQDSRALAFAEQAFKLAPANPVVQDTLGWILVEQGQAPRGLELLRKALVNAPMSTAVRYHHAVALVRVGNKSEARTALENLLKDTPNFPEAGAARSLLGGL